MVTLRPSESPPWEFSCWTARRTPRSWSRPVAPCSPLWGPSTAIISDPAEPDPAVVGTSATMPVRTAKRPMLARLVMPLLLRLWHDPTPAANGGGEDDDDARASPPEDVQRLVATAIAPPSQSGAPLADRAYRSCVDRDAGATSAPPTNVRMTRSSSSSTAKSAG